MVTKNVKVKKIDNPPPQNRILRPKEGGLGGKGVLE